MVWASFTLRPSVIHHESFNSLSRFRPVCLLRSVSTAAAIRNGLQRGGRETYSRTPQSKPSRFNESSTNNEGRSTFRGRPERKEIPFSSKSRMGDFRRPAFSSFKERQNSRGLKATEERPWRGFRVKEGAQVVAEPASRQDSRRAQSQYKPIRGPLRGEEASSVTRNRDSADVHKDSPALGRERPLRPAKQPLAMPYTTPASEFLYGTSVVTAALRSDRRKLYNLYIYQGENRLGGQQDESIKKLSLARGIKVTIVQTPEWLSLMDRMSTGRPHNGYILEASPLAKRPVTCLRSVNRAESVFTLGLDHQSREDESINGTDDGLGYDSSGGRYPLVLMLDGIIDPGNLGAIVRSSFFLGADAIVISTHSAPLGAVALKASAGAIESMSLLSLRQTGSFIRASQKHGWKFFAAVAPPSLPNRHQAGRSSQQHLRTSDVGDVLMRHPCVLMLGGEGSGLKRDLQNKADFTLSVEGGRSGTGGLDSLNVSVASGLLCDAFLKGATDLRPAEGQLAGSVLF